MEINTQVIRDQNDVCRDQIYINEVLRMYPCKVVHTAGIEAFKAGEIIEIYESVRKYGEFDEGNDAHGEHDFGSFEFNTQKIFWKFDYYSLDMEGASENPSDPNRTMRVLNILLASEY